MKKILFLAVFVSCVLTGVYTVITLYDSNLKAGRMYQTPAIRPHEEPEPVMDKRTVASGKSEALVKVQLSNNIMPAALPWSKEVILAKGKKDYRSFCSHCHGPNLDGLGTVGQSFSPLPTNLTGEKTAKMSDKELFSLISDGGNKAPPLASSMSVESREAVIVYIRSMQKNAY